MKQMQLSWRLLARNWKALLLFEMAYKALCTLLFFPLFGGLFSLSIQAAGLSYLAGDDIAAYLESPLAIVLLLLLLLFAALAILLESGALIYCFHASYHSERVRVRELFFAGLGCCKRVLTRRSPLIVLYVVILVPFLNFGVQTGLIGSLDIPEFIDDYIANNAALTAAYAALRLLLTLLALNWLFSLHYFTLNDMRFSDARAASRTLIRGKRIASVIALAGWNLLVVLAQLAVSFGLTELIVLIAKAFMGEAAARFAYLASGIAVLAVSSLTSFFSMPASYALLSGLFYTYSAKKGLPVPPLVRTVPAARNAWPVRAVALAAALLAVASVYLTVSGALPRVDIDPINHIDVQAHRGSSVSAPENTMPAFLAAMEDGADWIELDVHQTADGVIVVTHDADLMRIAGVNRPIYELTYDELEQYDTGSWFDPAFSYVRVSTLDEVIKAAKGKIKLNIELKPTGHEPDFEAHVIDIVRANDFQDDCVLASLSYPCLENIKRIDPDMTTLFIMAFAAGDLTRFTAADHFSLEATSINSKLLARLHAGGHKVYAWTVNQESNVEKMVALEVDGIITDDPVRTREVINSESLPDIYQAFIAWQLPEAAPVDPADTKIESYDLGS